MKTFMLVNPFDEPLLHQFTNASIKAKNWDEAIQIAEQHNAKMDEQMKEPHQKVQKIVGEKQTFCLW